ncbi:MAG: class II fructose-bisphosphate aldolase [Spirochaetia bacterium]|nr:class II fructose-bisphosphate aldolase [Spirochaetia bacterium]
MSLCTLHDLVEKAKRSDYAVPAFNFFTFEDAKAIVRGAEELKSPVILMASGSCIRSMGVDIAAAVIHSLAKKASVPVVAHLDHADKLDIIFQAIQSGFTSVMYDGSMLPVDENIANTKIVMRVAKALGVSVEAEIGRVGKGEEGQDASEILTTPESAIRFMEETQVDALAVAVGTRHAMQEQEAKIHFDIVESLSNVLNVPLVLHGSSGVTDEELGKIIKTSFGKINIGTVLRRTFTQGIKNTLSSQPNLMDHLKLLEISGKDVSEKVKNKISILNSSDKA